MELHPIWEADAPIAEGLWHVISALGDSPSLRVGHTATHVQGDRGSKGSVYIIGGANPSESFSEVHCLNLDTFSWDSSPSSEFKARYEHMAFAPACSPKEIFILLGADQDGNLDSVQAYNVTTGKCRVVEATGTAPSPRTHHTSAVIGDCCYVFSGGKSGAEPVGDKQVYCFNAADSTWKTLSVQGKSPTPRLGHTIIPVGKSLFLFGGMSGPKFYDDLYTLDTNKSIWECAKTGGKQKPSPRAAHAAVSCGSALYVFGGLYKDTALSDLWCLDTVTMKWSQIDFDGPPPACRLDLAACPIILSGTEVSGSLIKEVDGAGDGDIAAAVGGLEIKEETGGDSNSKDEASSVTCTGGERSEVTVFYIHGGMDTQGEIFDDSMACILTPKQ